MCWNKSVIAKPKQLKEEFELFKNLSVEPGTYDSIPQYNAVRLQRLPVIGMRDGKLKAFTAQWWLVPHWSKDGKTQATTFNATAERIDVSPLFAPYFKGSRCLIPVAAFFEYNVDDMVEVHTNGKRRKVKQPYCIRMKDRENFLMAGVFSVWKDQTTGEEKPTYAVITTEPNNVMKPIHRRMPVILDERHAPLWLDREYRDVAELKKLLAPFPASNMKAWKVSAEYLYDRTHNDERCWEKA